MNRYAIMLALLMVGCSKTKCINEDGCDTGAEEAGPTGPVSIEFRWSTPAAFEVVVIGLSSGTLGMAETGLGGTGYYLEDCISPAAQCHAISEGTNTFYSQHQNATGEPWDGTLDDNQTALHQSSEENLTYAVWANDGSCVAVAGHNVEYYGPHGCVNL